MRSLRPLDIYNVNLPSKVKYQNQNEDSVLEFKGIITCAISILKDFKNAPPAQMLIYVENLIFS